MIEFFVKPLPISSIERRDRALLPLNRYKKQVHDHDAEGATKHFLKSAAAGAIAGAMSHGKKGALIGAGAGLGAVAAVRAATAHTKDDYGERSHAAKAMERVPQTAAAAAAAAIGAHKLVKTARKLRGFSADVIDGCIEVLPETRFDWSDAVDHIGQIAKTLGKRFAGAPSAAGGLIDNLGPTAGKFAIGAGALGGASAIANAALPDDGQSRVDSATHGLIKDGIFGGALYTATEPVLKKLLPKGAAALIEHEALTPGMIEFRLRSSRDLFDDHHSDAEGRDTGGKFKDSLRSYIERDRNYRGEQVEITDKPVLRNVYRRAQKVNRIGTRAARIGADALQAARGQRKVDERGRPVKREWEKSWASNALKDVAIGGATLGGAALLRKNPRVYGRLKEKAAALTGSAGRAVARGTKRARASIDRLTDIDRHLAPPAKKARMRTFTVNGRERVMLLDYHDSSGWDVRDARGKSARVFAPGSLPRQRREKFWHEKVSNQRKALAALATAGTVAGVIAGHHAGLARGATRGAAEHAERAAAGKIVDITKLVRSRRG